MPGPAQEAIPGVHHILLLLKVRDLRIILVQIEGQQGPQHRLEEQIILQKVPDPQDPPGLFRRKKVVHQRAVNPNHHQGHQVQRKKLPGEDKI